MQMFSLSSTVENRKTYAKKKAWSISPWATTWYPIGAAQLPESYDRNMVMSAAGEDQQQFN
jgi:hypothetical protein